jgi:hypothetical protein
LSSFASARSMSSGFLAKSRFAMNVKPPRKLG